jgi:hypothetical protein
MKNNWCGEFWGIFTSGNYPEKSAQHSEHVESLKSRNLTVLIYMKMEKQV